MPYGKRIKKKGATNKRSKTLMDREMSMEMPSVQKPLEHTSKSNEATSEPQSAPVKAHERFRRILATIPQSPPTKVTAMLDSTQGKSLPSRDSSPETDITPQPLHILKSRKSFLRLADMDSNSSSSSASVISTNGPRVFTGCHKQAQFLDIPPDTAPQKCLPLSPLPRIFMGIRLAANPKSRIPSPVGITQDVFQHIQITEGVQRQEAKFPINKKSPVHVTKVKIDEQRSRSASGPIVTTPTSPSSFLAFGNIPHWMDWRPRSNSDGHRARPLRSDDKGLPQVMSANHNIMYHGACHIESGLPPIEPCLSSVASPPREIRALSTSSEPLTLSRNLGNMMTAQPLATVMGNIDTTIKTGIEPKGVFSKMLASMQDLSHFNQKRDLKFPSITSVSSRQTSTSLIDAVGSSSTAKAEAENVQCLDENENSKTKGSFRVRGTFGSIRRRFGSGTGASGASSRTTCEAPSTVQAPEIEVVQTYSGQPPMLRANIEISSELLREHVEGGSEFWVSIEIEGRVSWNKSASGIWPNPRLTGLDITVIMDLSAHASPSTFNQTKSTARRIISHLTSADRISLIAFTSIQSSPGVEAKYPLTRSTPTAREKLLNFVDGLFDQVQRQGTFRHDLKSLIASAMYDLRKAGDDEGWHRLPTAHVLLLAPCLRGGDLPEENFTQQQRRVCLHFLGMGPLVTMQKHPSYGSWVINNLSVNEPVFSWPEGRQGRQNGISHLLDVLRCEINIGILRNVHIGLYPSERCKLMEIVGETTIEALYPGEKRVICVKLYVGPYNPITAPDTPANTPEKRLPGSKNISRRPSVGSLYEALMKEKGESQAVSERKLLERQLAATLGVIETKALTVKIRYEHDYFGNDTIIMAKKDLRIQRFDGDGKWSLGWNGTRIPFHNLTAEEEGQEEVDPVINNARTLLAKQIAEMNIGLFEDNPKKALRAIEDCGIRGKGVHAIASELEWRIKMKDDEEESDRTMRVLTGELLTKGARREVELEHRAGYQAIANNMRGVIFNHTMGVNSLRSSYSWRTGLYSQGCASDTELDWSYNPQLVAEDVQLVHEQNTHGSESNLRSSSVVIHRAPVDRETTPASEATDFSEPRQQDELAIQTNIHKIPSSRPHHQRYRQDHVDEAGRIWKELAETKMGLRRDVRSRRYPGGARAITKNSRSSSLDIRFDRDREMRSTNMERRSCVHVGGGRNSDRQKQRQRRAKKQQGFKRGSKGRLDDVAMGLRGQGKVRVNSSITLQLGMDSQLDAGAVAAVKKEQGFQELQSEQQEDWAQTISHRDHSGTLEGSEETPSSLRNDSTVISAGQSNRDTMKSLITLRDVKETDFSPWAC